MPGRKSSYMKTKSCTSRELQTFQPDGNKDYRDDEG